MDLFNLDGKLPSFQYQDIDSNLSDKQLRDKYLTNKLSIKEKMDL